MSKWIVTVRKRGRTILQTRVVDAASEQEAFSAVALLTGGPNAGDYELIRAHPFY